MPVTSQMKQEAISKFDHLKANLSNTGSVAAQVAILTARISLITQHVKKHRKDFSSTRGLITLVNKRKKLLKYIKNRNESEYLNIIQTLSLRK